MTTTDPNPRRAIVVAIGPALALLGVAAAGIFGVALLRRDNPGRPDALLETVLGSFLALVALGGSVVLAGRWRRPVGGALARLLDRARRRAPPPVLRSLRPLALGSALVGATVWLSIVFHDLALSHDHAEHCFKAFHFWTEMLGRGRLKGWTHFLAFGYPSGELTPFGPELWVALFRAATLGLLSWTQTYALAFSGVVVFATATVYFVGNRHFGRAAGVIAAIVWALDPGGWYQGGWFWLEWLGVWPVTLAMSFTLLALVKLIDVLADGGGQDHPADAPPGDHAGGARDRLPARDRRRRDTTWAVIWMLASLVTHQLPLVVYAITLPGLLLCAWLGGQRLSVGAVARFGATVALGAGIPAFYLIPMLARNGLTEDLGVRGFALDELGRRLVEMRVFDAGWAPIAVLGFMGCARAIRARAPARLFFALSAAIFVLLSSDVLVGVLHVERLMPGILKIECQRMLLIAKLFWFPLAGDAAVSVLRAPAGAPPMPPARQLTAVLVIAALGALVVKPVALHIFNTQIDRSVEHRGASPLASELRAFFDWSAGERRVNAAPYRIAYTLTDLHDHIVSIAPVFNQTQLYKVGYTSAQQFRNFPMSAEPELFEALSVEYVLADHDLSGPAFVLQRSFGHLRLYRFTGYRARHPFTLTGAGQVDLVELAPERIRLRLQGISPGARLKLHVARFPRWQATLNGRVVPIAPATVSGIVDPFLMEVPAADGELSFRYVRRAPDWAGLSITLIALALFAALATGRIDVVGRQRWARRGWSFVERNATRAAAIAGALALLAAGVAVARIAVPPHLPPDHPFVAATSTGQITLAGQRCVAHGATRWQCGAQLIHQDVVSGIYGSHICLTTPGSGPLVLSMAATLGSYLEVTYDPAGHATGRVRVSVDGATIGDGPTRGEEQGLQFLQVDTRSRAGTVARLGVEIEGPALHCFDLHIAR